MGINITLLLQMFHFLLVYIVLDHVFLRLATAMVRAEDKKIMALETEIADQQMRIEGRIRYNEEDWQILQKRLHAECPSQVVGKMVRGVHEPDLEDMVEQSPATISGTEELSRCIVERIAKGPLS